MMDPFDRYVRVLRLFLPRAERDDIVNELREDYRAQIADTERARARSLTDAERAAVIRRFGHPLTIAARYWRQQQLIGPKVFPFYWPAVAAALLLNLVVHAVSAAILFGLHRSMTEVFTIVDDLWPSSFMLVGVVTVVFAVVERAIGHGHTPLFRKAQEMAGRTVQRAIEGVAPALEMTEAMIHPADARRRSAVGGQMSARERSVTGLIVTIVFVAWWLLALRIPSLMFLTAGDQLAWAPAMDRIYPAIAVANLLFLAGECLRRTSRHHSPLTRLLGIAAVFADVVFLALIITSDYRWVIWQGTPLGGREADIVGLVNIVVTAVMLSVAFGVAARWLRAIAGRLTPGSPRTAAA